MTTSQISGDATLVSSHNILRELQETRSSSTTYQNKHTVRYYRQPQHFCPTAREPSAYYTTHKMAANKPSTSSTESLLSATTSTMQSVCESIISTIRNSLDTVVPPSQRSAAKSRAKSFAQQRPLLASFILSHLVFSGIPLLLFTLQAASILAFSLATALLVGALCAFAFTAVCVGLATLFVAPVLLLTGCLGFGAWCWAWMGWYILRWIGVVERGGSLTVGTGEREERSANVGGKGIKTDQVGRSDPPVVDGKVQTSV